MFSFFKRNKTTSTAAAAAPSSSRTAPVNNESGTTKVSQNIQNAIERQQASLQQMLDQRRQSQSNALSEVNDRLPKAENWHSLSSSIEESYASKNRMLPLSASEMSGKQPTRTSDSARSQNYDQFRDAKRRSNLIFESIVPRHTFTSINSAADPSTYSPTTITQIASSVTEVTEDERCFTSYSVDDEYNSVDETMARGRNRNRHRSSGHGSNSNATQQLKNSSEKQSGETSSESKAVSSSENCTNVHKRSFSCEGEVNESSKRVAKISGSDENENPNKSAHADDEYSEKSTNSISLCESVFHDENSCSINSRTSREVKNKRDNMTTSDDVVNDDEDCADDDDAGARRRASCDESENDVKKCMSGVDNVCDGDDDGSDEGQQVNGSAPLQRSSSARRVTFAPSPTRSIASSSSSDDNETVSEDIFYDTADAAPSASSSTESSSQKLKILSTITSQSSDFMMKRIDEESSNETSCLHGLSSTGNDVVSGTMILSFDGSDGDKLESAFSEDKSNNIGETMKTFVKPSYMMIGDETVALPDIVAETSQHQQHNGKPSADEM